jgi:hypothetical protein
MFRNYYVNYCLSEMEMIVINMLEFRSYNSHN